MNNRLKSWWFVGCYLGHLFNERFVPTLSLSSFWVLEWASSLMKGARCFVVYDQQQCAISFHTVYLRIEQVDRGALSAQVAERSMRLSQQRKEDLCVPTHSIWKSGFDFHRTNELSLNIVKKKPITCFTYCEFNMFLCMQKTLSLQALAWVLFRIGLISRTSKHYCDTTRDIHAIQNKNGVSQLGDDLRCLIFFPSFFSMQVSIFQVCISRNTQLECSCLSVLTGNMTKTPWISTSNFRTKSRYVHFAPYLIQHLTYIWFRRWCMKPPAWPATRTTLSWESRTNDFYHHFIMDLCTLYVWLCPAWHAYLWWRTSTRKIAVGEKHKLLVLRKDFLLLRYFTWSIIVNCLVNQQVRF